MVLSDMDDGGFLDVINENDLFGNAIGTEESGSSDFNWADEFLSTTGVDDNAANAHVVQNETISPVEVAPLSIQNHIAVQQNVVNAQSYLPQSSAMPAQGVPRSSSLGGMQIVQGATGLVQQATATAPTQQINMSAMGQLQQGLAGQQIVQGPNGQLILKPGGGGQIFFQTHPQIQSLQSSTTQASSIQQVPGSSQVINRILAPSQSPVSTSPIVSRAITPVTSSHVGRSLTPIQSWAGVNPVTMVTNNANTQQVFTRNIPIQFSNPNAGIQLQGQSAAVLQQGQGAILQQGQGQSTLLQPAQGNNTLLQGQGQAAAAAAVLQGQGQNIVNTQNTVIQNPNVVNLNVAHVLCNNSQLQNQSGSTVHHMAPNIQGTLIQTADGKHIIIPNNNAPQTVAGQSINFQNLPQMTIQPQLNIAQNTSSGSNMVFGNTNNLAGNLGNVIRVATQGANTPTPTPAADKANQPQQPSHYIGVNQQGQQILIQRTNNAAGQQQNIILRTLNPNIVQLSQQQQQQPLQTASGIQTAPQIAATPAGTQQVLVTSQAQPQGIQLQRIVNTSQGQQQVKFISQGGQAAGMPLTINWQGMQNATNSAIPAAIHVVPQQQVPKTSDGNDVTIQQQQSSSQVGMVLSSQPINVKSISNQNQLIQQHSQAMTPRQTVYSTPSSSKISLSSAPPQQNDITTTLTSASPQLVQNLQGVQIPLVSQYSVASATPNLSTASTTTVTTTVTQSPVTVTTTSQSVNQVMSSVQPQQLVAGTSQKQNVLQARNSAPKLQHTIQLSHEAQTQLHQIQENLKKLGTAKNLGNAQKVQRKHLLELQKKILSEGQIIRQTIQTATSPLPQQLVTQQPQQPVQLQTQNLIGQNVQLIGQSQNIQTPSHLVIGQQLPKPVVGQGSVIKQEVTSFQGSVKDITQGTMGIVQSQQQTTQFVQAPIAGPATQAGNLVIKTEALPTSSFSTMVTSAQVSPSISISLSQPSASLLAAKPNEVKVEQIDHDSSQVASTGSKPVLMNQLPVGAVPSGVVMATAPPGKMAISASPKVALPTPIKIGNHTLNLNLTVDQKEKVQGYLSKMTPEQQQQQISLFLKLQRQQQLQAQVNAQVKAQQALQQKQTVGASSSKLPVTVQQLENKGATAAKPAEIPPIATPVSTATMSTVSGLRLPFAAIPKSQLIHQQLSKDQDNALKPDTKTPFRSRRDTYRRLLRYHVFQCKSPPEGLMEKDHEVFKNVAAGLLHKKQKMFDKFRLLLLKESMRENRTAEMVMIQRLMNDDLTETIKSEKELAKSDPDSFEPMPLRFLQKQESVKSEDVSMDEQDVPDISKVKSEKMSDSDTCVEIKKEQTSRPCTPKVKLVIRSDGQNFTSSLAEDGSSDSNDSSYHDNNESMDTSEMERQNSNTSRSDSDDISKGMFGAPHLTNIKTEPMNDESESMESEHWSDSNKPFKLYLGTDTSPVSNSDLDTAGYGRNSSPSPMQNEVSRRQYEVHAEEVSSPDGNTRRNSDSPSYEMNDESVSRLISSDSNCDNNVLGYHSSEKQSLSINSFTEKNLYHSHDYPQQSESSDKQSFKPSFMSDSKVPFSIGNELFNRVVGDSSQSKPHVSNSDESDSAMIDVSGFQQSQYEPISSPEADHDESFSSMITHKVDSAYTIGMAEHKEPQHMPNSDMPFNVPAFSSARLDVEPRESVEDDEATTLYSDDSDKESDSQQELLKAQMESAINSIVSLNQDSSVHSPFSLDQSNEFFSRHSYMTNPTMTESESDTPGPSTPVRSVSPVEDTNDVSMDDDLDAAVNSILM
ncbi:BRD4-interacting chromatin-remodeling complex-associated protein-like [Argopecten irradians]|uniref:BRD4-interacting chromatin-remodeling complex-associated protein-like n=1 Tax=Argopecten irradians TaxID=31199 RepID=UPI00371DE3CC